MVTNYNIYSKELFEKRKASHENIPQSILNRDGIIEVLERRQCSLDGFNEHYEAVKQQLEHLVDDEELRLYDQGESLSDEERDKLYDKFNFTFGIDELEKDKTTIDEGFYFLEEEHFEQIETLNKYLNEFEAHNGYESFAVSKLDTYKPLVIVQASNNNKIPLELSEENHIPNNDIANNRITTIIQAEFDNPVDADMPADLIFTDFINNKQYTLAINIDSQEEDSHFEFWLDDEDMEPYYLEDIFDEETSQKIKDAINNHETIHVSNPTEWFGYETPGEFLYYLQSEGLSENLDEHTYLYIKDDKLHLNGVSFAPIENDTVEISPYNFEEENPIEIIRDKIYNLNPPVTNLSLKELDLDKLEDKKDNVITTENDANADAKVKSLILGTSAPNVDKELMSGAYELYTSFAAYYNDKFNIEENEVIKNHFQDRFGEIEEHREGLEQNLISETSNNTDNFYAVRDNVSKNITDATLNLPSLQLPSTIRKDIETSFNRYKKFANEEVTTIFNNLNEHEDNSKYINAVSFKKLDETFVDTLQGKKSVDYYEGMKDFAKLAYPSQFENDKQEKREESLENMFTMKNYLQNKNSLETNLNLDNNTLSTQDKKVSFNFSEIENDPQKCLNTFESYANHRKQIIDLEM